MLYPNHVSGVVVHEAAERKRRTKDEV